MFKKMLSQKRVSLIIVSILFIGLMFVLVPWLTESLGKLYGLALLFGLYWFGFCLPMGLFFQGWPQAKLNLSIRLDRHKWISWVVIIQVVVIGIGSWFLRPEIVPFLAIISAILCGVVNGFFEEFFWRGSFLEVGRESVLFQLIGVALFTLWHIPLTLVPNMTYEGGSIALVGGAFGLGLFWSRVAHKTGKIGWPIIGHIGANIAVFIGLFSVNFF